MFCMKILMLQCLRKIKKKKRPTDVSYMADFMSCPRYFGEFHKNHGNFAEQQTNSDDRMEALNIFQLFHES